MTDKNIENRRQTVVVAGGNYCSNLSMARSLGEAGYDVIVLRVLETKPKWFQILRYMNPEAHSRYVKEYHVCVSDKDDRNIAHKLIEIADKSSKTVLIPTDDIVAGASDRFLDELKSFYYLPDICGTAGKISELMSKSKQKKMAEEAGLPVAEGWNIDLTGDKIEIPDDISFPCLTKPDVSRNSNKKRIQKINDREELENTLKQFSKYGDSEILLEKLIDVKREYSLLGISTEYGVLIPGFFGVNEGAHGPHVGVALTGELVSQEKYASLVNLVAQFVKSTGFTGLFDIDLIEDTSGKMYFVELNLRYGASGYVLTKSGANLPALFAEYMLSGKKPECNADDEMIGKTFISEKVMLEEYVNGYLSKAECEKHFKKADIYFVKDENDIESYKYFMKAKYYAPLLKLAYYVKRKIS